MTHKIGNMYKALDEVTSLQQQASSLKKWLIQNHNASPESIKEQRRRLNDTLQQISKSVK